MATVGDVRVKISANAARVQGALRKVTASLKRFGTVAIKAGKIAAAAMAAFAAAALKAATTVEGAFRKIQVATGATGQTLKTLKEDFRTLFAGVPDAAGTVADALGNVNTLFGVSGEEARALTKQILDFSRITGGDASQNSLQFGRAMQQFGVNAKDSTDLLDTFFKITQETGIGFDRLTRDLREFGPVLKLANIGADEGARLIGRLSKEGINFTRVSPALRQGFINFAKEGKNAREELQKYIDRVKNAANEQEATKILTEAFGTEVGRLASVMRSGAFALDENAKAIDRNRGAIAKTERETRTFGDEMAKLRNMVVVNLAPVGDVFLKVFRDNLPAIEKFIETAGRKLPAAMRTGFQIIASLISTVGPTFLRILNTLQIALKGVALAGVTLGLGISKAVAAIQRFRFGAQSEEAKRAQKAVEDISNVWDRLADSIGEDVQEFKNASKAAEGLADKVAAVGQEFDTKVKKNVENVTKETEKVKEKTEEVQEETKKLKEPTNQFIGTIKVAGREIDVQLNQKLEVTKQKLVEINSLARQAATSTAGAG